MRKSNPVPGWHRQPPAAILLMIAAAAKNILRQFWPLFTILLINQRRRTEMSFLLVFLILSVGSLLYSIVAYFRFFYRLDEENLYLKAGIWQRKSLQLPFERVQSVRIEQSLVHQALGLVKLELDTAGAKTSEFTINALTKAQAEAIQEYIFSRKEAEAAAHPTSGDIGAESIGADRRSAPEEPLLFRLGVGSLVKIGVTENHFRTLGILLAFLYGLAESLLDITGNRIEQYAEEIPDPDWFVFLFYLLVLMPLVFLAAITVSVGRTMIRFADFEVYRSVSGLKIRSGLFTRIQQTAVRRKMQVLSLETNPLRRVFRLTRIRIYQASSEEVESRESIEIPGCAPADRDQVISEYLDPALIGTAAYRGVDRRYRIRQFLIYSILIGGGLLLLPAFRVSPGLFVVPLVPVFLWWYTGAYHRRMAYGINGDWLIWKSGVFARRTQLLMMYKVQGVELSRSFYQLRNGLATVVVHTAARSVSIPFLPLAEARHLMDYLLYRIERDRRPWM